MFSLETGSILVIPIFFVSLWVITKIFQSDERSAVKLLWTITIFILPALGCALWYFIGPRKEDLPQEKLGLPR
ncbi:PLD nuclease N-terminal domain-containing protein [Kiloniella sp. EL199]|uniref:PLD nuclease N-terminal domain-containing protein n=1 Tax=Kiloniella sp. EL199 TaxID=2107581 RepID=UPI000EA00646|nr:PLD nuclease N-terminal domain-containing protein [Kiloniella sp. EL199]